MLTSAVFVVLAIIAIQVSGQSDDCQQVIVGLAPCLDYIQGNATKPSSGCCTQLATIVKNQPQCLCQVVNGGSASSMGINVNQTQAMALPKACNVQTPSVNICKGKAKLINYTAFFDFLFIFLVQTLYIYYENTYTKVSPHSWSRKGLGNYIFNKK